MNSKKAKRLRQLVKHLQDKGAIEGGDWAQYGTQQHVEDGRVVKQRTAMLDPACGRAIYQQMKNRALTGKTH